MFFSGGCVLFRRQRTQEIRYATWRTKSYMLLFSFCRNVERVVVRRFAQPETAYLLKAAGAIRRTYCDLSKRVRRRRRLVRVDLQAFRGPVVKVKLGVYDCESSQDHQFRCTSGITPTSVLKTL